MNQKILASLCIAVCMFAYQANAFLLGVCNLKSSYTILETAPSGTVILNATKPLGTTVTFTVKGPFIRTTVPVLRNHLSLTNGDRTFQLENSNVLDLEWFMLTYQVDVSTIILTFKCGETNHEVFINVTPVNEFAPVFHNAPYNITLKESLKVGYQVFSLKPMVTDSDVGFQIFTFAIHKYNRMEYDGSAYFRIPSEGNIYLARPLNFDTMNGSKLFLNLSVSDYFPLSSASRTSYTTLEINVQDVDDQPPSFEYPNCPPPCPAPQYLATIRLNHSGPLSIQPTLHGNDSDTLGTRLVYSIKSGNQHNLFSMNPDTGSVNQLKSVNDAGLPDKEFRLVIEVSKDLGPCVHLSSVAILTVKVYERMTI